MAYELSTTGMKRENGAKGEEGTNDIEKIKGKNYFIPMKEL